ncbi:glutamine cyclotransferase [Bacteroidia bacterium]|nr:glutamine cyclotransferase [Bacteroidia bacterium]
MKHLIRFLIFSLLFISCGNTQGNKISTADSVETGVDVPDFSADSAYLYVKKQVDFGVRAPNTAGHKACAAYLASELRRFGAEVTEQQAVLTAYDGTRLNAVNIIGSFNPKNKTRILLVAHWDSRPFADNDPDTNKHKTPILGANDGASGVGVLLEMARQFGEKLPETGVDIVFFDAEDYGQPYFDKRAEATNSWCLGSQYWAQNPHVPNYHARYGILLDMVGAKGASFKKDKISTVYAPHVVDKVWARAESLGYASFFRDEEGGYITDDHVYVNEIIGIPCIDIIDFDNGFFEHWHTVKDDMSNIDKNTLKAVGATLLEVVYSEK